MNNFSQINWKSDKICAFYEFLKITCFFWNWRPSWILAAILNMFCSFFSLALFFIWFSILKNPYIPVFQLIPLSFWTKNSVSSNSDNFAHNFWREKIVENNHIEIFFQFVLFFIPRYSQGKLCIIFGKK